MKMDTAIPPRYRRIYKGKQHHTPPFTFQRRNGGCIYKNKRADNRISSCVLSALRLCVRLFDNGYFQFLNVDQRFLFTFWAV